MDDHYTSPNEIAALALDAAQAAQLWAAFDSRSLPLEAATARADLVVTIGQIADALK